MALSLDGTAYTGTVPKSTNFKTDPLKHCLVVQHAAMPCQSIPPRICRLQLAGECATFPGADESTSVPIDCQSITTSHFSLSVSAVASVSNQIRVAG